MVALLVRLRFRVLANTLRRNIIQLVAVLAGGVQALIIIAVVLGALIILASFPIEVIRNATTIGGATLVLGWLVVPVFTNGVEQTLDPVKLARFPIRRPQLMVAMIVVGLAWVPGATSLVISLGTAFAWRGIPEVALVSLVVGVIGTLTCVIGSRMMTSVIANLLAGRRVPARVAVLTSIALIVLGPVVVGFALGAAKTGAGGVNVADEVIGWSPIGAIWSVPGKLATGQGLAALGAGVEGIVVLVVTTAVWAASLSATNRHRGVSAARTVAAGHLGLFGIVPATPIGAIAARSLEYWFRDARYSRQLLIVPVLPALIIIWAKLIGAGGLIFAAPEAVAALLPLATYAMVSYDGTAFAAHLAAGVRGRDDRIGRIIAVGIIAAPSTVVVSVVASAVAGDWSTLPAVLGMSFGVLLSALAVVCVSSALVVVPVPSAGRNPFSGAAGSGITSVAGSYAVTGITLALGIPELGFGIASLVTRSIALGWAALVVGLLLGSVALVIGVRVGGTTLDRTGPSLLARLKVLRA